MRRAGNHAKTVIFNCREQTVELLKVADSLLSTLLIRRSVTSEIVRVVPTNHVAKGKPRCCFCRWHFESSFSEFDAVCFQSCRIVWNDAFDGHRAVQGHSRLSILVLIEIPCATSDLWKIPTYILSCTVSEISRRRPIIQINAFDRSACMWLPRFEWTPKLSVAKFGLRKV